LRKINNAYANHLCLTWIKAPLAAAMNTFVWQSVTTAPFDQDIEVAELGVGHIILTPLSR
jgi:hypothetical protein